MRRWRRNSQVPCTRWRFMRRRRGKRGVEIFFPLPGGPSREGEKLERGAGPLRLFLLGLGLARHGDDTQRGDAVALAAQHPETKAVEGKTLSAFRDRARLVNHQARNRGR